MVDLFFTLYAAATMQFMSPGDTPYNPIPYTIDYGYQGYHTYNNNRPESVDVGMPGSWVIPSYGMQGNDKMVWFRVKIPAEMWWEFRIDHNMYNSGNPNLAGVQLIIFDNNTMLPYSQTWQGIAGSGAMFAYANRASGYIWLEPGYYLVAVDGWGNSEGKFKFSVLRSTEGCCELYYYPHPYLPPPEVQIIFE